MRVVIDSSVYIDWLKRKQPFVSRLRPFLERDALLTSGVIRCEVLRGIIQEAERSRMEELFALSVEVAADHAFWDGVWQLGWKMDRKGIVLPLTDLSIAFMAIRHDATLITLDKHFARIPGLNVAPRLPGDSHKIG